MLLLILSISKLLCVAPEQVEQSLHAKHGSLISCYIMLFLQYYLRPADRMAWSGTSVPSGHIVLCCAGLGCAGLGWAGLGWAVLGWAGLAGLGWGGGWAALWGAALQHAAEYQLELLPFSLACLFGIKQCTCCYRTY